MGNMQVAHVFSRLSSFLLDNIAKFLTQNFWRSSAV